MGKVFTRKQFSNYLGEQRAILDVDTSYFLDPSPTPSSTPSGPSPTPSSTPIPPSPTPTPSPTPVPFFNIGSGFDGDVDAIVIDPTTNDIFVSGQFNFYDGNASMKVVKIDTNGTIDPVFTSGFVNLNTSRAYDMAVDGNDIWVVGTFAQNWNGTFVTRMLKVDTTTGNFSSGWDYSKIPNNSVYTVDVLPGNKVLITGTFTSYDGVTRNRIARINSDGTLDTSITFGTGFNTTAYKMVINNNGNYVCVGAFTTYDGSTANRVIEIDSTTGLDTGLFGSGFNNVVNDVVYDTANDEYYFLTNDNVSYQGGLTRQIHVVDNTGTEINNGNIQTGTVPHVLYFDKTNLSMYMGRSSFGNINYWKFDPTTLAVDTTWSGNIGVSNYGTTAAGQAQIVGDGSHIYLTGRFTSMNSINYNRIYRVNLDGTSNTTI